MNNTKIEWCDSTWNPVTGCLHGCEYCYARGIAERFKPFDLPHLTEKGIYERLNELDTPIITACKNGKDRVCAYPYGFEPTLHRYRLDDPQKQKKPRTIFVCSMADLFGDWVPDEWIEAVFEACGKAPQHRYLFLTKNPERYVKFYEAGKLPLKPNIWYGSTITNNNTAFLHSNVCNSFLSIEPLMSDFSKPRYLGGYLGIKWIIIGAETGNRKNKVIPQKEWIEHIVEYSDKKGIFVFMKDSLIPIVGEENMRREFPWKTEVLLK